MVTPMTLHYEERGEGPVLLNLHGWPAEHGQMMAMMEPLFPRKRAWRRIYPDLPGMGKSPGPAWMTSHDQMLDVISEFVDLMAPGRPIVVAGHSYGALLANGLRHRHPDRIAAMFLLSPPAPAGSPVQASPPLVFAEDQQFDAELTEVERTIVDLIHVRTLPVLHLLRSQAIPGVEAADEAFLARLAAGPDFSYLAEPSPTFPGPALILSGRQEPAGQDHIVALLARCPRATCAVLDRTGHLLFAEQPALLAALVNEWLDRVEEVLT